MSDETLDEAWRIADRLVRQNAGDPVDVQRERIAEALREQREAARKERFLVYRGEPVSEPDFGAEAGAFYAAHPWHDPTVGDHDDLAGFAQRMYDAGREESGTLLDLSELEDQLKRARARREKLLALADRWERDAKTGTFYATREGADDVRLTLLRCARELRTLLQSPESDSD